MDARSPITVAVTRFEDLLALGIHAALSGDPSIELVASDVEVGRIGVVVRARRPQVVVLDVTGLEQLVEVRTFALAHPGTRLVLVGPRSSSADTAQLLAFGASAYLARDTQTRDLLNAVHLAARGMQLHAMPAATEAEPAGRTLLTPREAEVLQLLREDRSNAQIAATLQIGVETVRSHARSIYRKLGVTSRRALLALSVTPLVTPPAGPPQGVPRRRTGRSVPARRR